MKPVKAPAEVKAPEKSSDKPMRSNRNVSKTDQTFTRPKMVIKITAKKLTKKETDQHVSQGSSRKSNGRILRSKQDAKSVSSHAADYKIGATEEENITVTLQSQSSGETERRRRRRRGKVVWTTALVKRKQRASRLRSIKAQSSLAENAEKLEVNHRRRRKEIGASGQEGTVSPKEVKKKKRIPKGASLESGSIQQQKIQDSQGQDSSMHRKRRRLGHKNLDSTCHTLQPVEEQKQPIGEIEKSTLAVQTELTNISAKPVVTARSSRVIRLPKRFMDDESMSALPDRGSPKKTALSEIPMETGKLNIEISQSRDSTVKQKTLEEPQILKNAEMSILKELKSQRGRPVLSSARVDGGRRGRGGRISQSNDYKIYWKLKKLNASLARRKMQRIASASNRLDGEDAVKMETHDTEKAIETGRRKIQDVCSPGLVPKVVIRIGVRSDQSPFTSLAEGCDPAKENGRLSLSHPN